jgi:hypothetical protein
VTADLFGGAPEPAPAAQRVAVGGPAAEERPDPTPVRYIEQLGDEYLHWAVVEADARAVPGARGARCLLFTRAGCVRRVWGYPADWRTLDDAGLAALSWRC